MVIDVADEGREDDGHDDTVDGDDFAEDDGDQVLGSDSRRFDTGTEDGRARDEDTPIGNICQLCRDQIIEGGVAIPCCTDDG